MNSEPCKTISLTRKLGIEKHFLGDETPEERKEALFHLESCAHCNDLLAKLQAEKAAFLIQHPFRKFAAKHLPEQRVVKKPAYAMGWRPALMGLALCLLIPAVLLLKPSEENDESFHARGGTGLDFYFERNGEKPAPGNPDSLFREGDHLQFVYNAARHKYVSLISIDAKGKTSLYKEKHASPSTSVAATTGDLQSMPFGITLDNSPDAEFFILVFSKSPLTDILLETWLQKEFATYNGNLEKLSHSKLPPPGNHSDAKGILLRKTQP